MSIKAGEIIHLEQDESTFSSKVLATNGEYGIASLVGNEEEDQTSLFGIKSGDIVWERTFSVPNSVSISDNKMAIVADWRVYGEKTDTDLILLDDNGEKLSSNVVEESSPLVAISPDSEYIVITGHNKDIQIWQRSPFQSVNRHNGEFGDRPIPQFEDNREIKLCHPRDEEELWYTIDESGKVIERSDQAETLRYLNSFDLDYSSDWPAVVEELHEVWLDSDSDSDPIQRHIQEMFYEASLARISELNRLKEIVKALEDIYRSADGDYERALSVVLCDSHYRLARAYRKEGNDIDRFFEHMEKAENYGSKSDDWYRAKKLLAKVYRRRARVWKQRNDIVEARSEVQTLFELEEKYGVNLTTDADSRLREDLT